MNLKELYQEIILEHGKNPRNLGKTDNFNKDAKGHNPLCGDNVHVYLKLNGQKIVEDISFEGSGCAISMASASIMTDLIKGKNEHEAKEIVEDFLGMIKENLKLNSENLKEDEKTKLMCLSGVKQYPMRVKCATLSWHTLISAIDNTQEEINTEKIDPTSNSLNQDLILRDDIAENKLSNEDLLRNVPDSELGFFVVPKVIE